MTEFERCIKRGGLRLFTVRSARMCSEPNCDSARDDLADAVFLAAHLMPKRTTIMALLRDVSCRTGRRHAMGYAEKSHFCLLVAFRELYGDTEEGQELARGIERARVLRENADYLAEFSPEAAAAVLEVARRFVGFVDRAVADTEGE